jgi:adenylate kinase
MKSGTVKPGKQSSQLQRKKGQAMTLEKGKVRNILVMGKSGAGKQPRIDVLVEEFGLEQLSTGNIFRDYLGQYNAIGFTGDIAQFFDEAKDAFVPDDRIEAGLGDLLTGHDTAGVLLGLKAKYYMESGKFVPDSITNALFESFFARSNYTGMVLDGYPRTADQATFLCDLVESKGTGLDAIVLVDNEDQAIVARTIGRRICPACQKVFHLEFKPPRDGKFCTECGTEVILRSDDSAEKIESRLREFHEKAVPALEALKAKGIPVAQVPGNLPVFTDEAVRASVMESLETL